MNTDSKNSQTRSLWFERGDQKFAVSMDCLYEVLSVTTLHPVPATEPALAGLTVLRGQVFPVLDPALLAGFEAPPVSASPVVVLLGVRGQPCLGLLAEKVGKVVGLSAPTPLSSKVRLRVAFSCETKHREMPRVFVLDIPALAVALGLIAESQLEEIPATPRLPTPAPDYSNRPQPTFTAGQ